MYRPYRRAAQIGVFAAMFIIPLLNLFEIYAITGTFYSVNIGGLSIADPVVILQAIVAVGRITLILVGSALFAVFVAFIFGRVWCGWMCPYHLVIDVACWLRNKLRASVLHQTHWESLKIPRPFSANIFRFGFLILGTVAAGAIGIPVLNYVSAPGIISTEAMIFVKQHTLSVEFGFIAILILVEFAFAPRFWCRLFCPTGTFLSLFRARFTLHVRTAIKSTRSACCKDNFCTAACPMGLSPFREGENLLCTNCGRCIDACRGHDGPGKLGFSGFSRSSE